MKRLLILMVLSRAFCQAVDAPELSQKRIDAIAKYWQGVLRLTDWHIRVRVVGINDLPEHCAAVGKWDHDLHMGAVLVMRPADYAQASERGWIPPLRGRAIVRDIEDSIVHELLHLRLQNLREADEEHMAATEEYTVVRLTDALLSAKRRWAR